MRGSIRPAQYLLRVDDLCPTVDGRRWLQIERLIDAYRLQPILAVVPCNEDPELVCEAADAEFWVRMRAQQAAGSAIGLHGLRHACVQRGQPLLPLHKQSEFAGASLADQRAWIHAGLESLRAHGLEARIWVAPRHGFDRHTLTALREEGVMTLSDGFTRRVVRRGGIDWVPQQLWAPLAKQTGLWTICLHPNRATEDSLEQLRRFVEQHADQFRSVPQVLAESLPTGIGTLELVREHLECARVRWRQRRHASSSPA